MRHIDTCCTPHAKCTFHTVRTMQGNNVVSRMIEPLRVSVMLILCLVGWSPQRYINSRAVKFSYTLTC